MKIKTITITAKCNTPYLIFETIRVFKTESKALTFVRHVKKMARCGYDKDFVHEGCKEKDLVVTIKTEYK